MDHDVAGKEFGSESGNIGKLPLLEWNKSSQVGKGGTNSSKDSLKLPNDVDFEQGMEELLYYDTDDGASISGKEGDLETWFGVKEVDQDIYVEWKDDPYHLVDELEDTGEINDMFAELDQAIDELDQVIEAEGVTDLLAVYDQTINDEEDVVQVEVVAEEMVTEEAVDVDDGEHVVSDGGLIPEELYAAIITQEGVGPVDDGDVIPDEVVTEIMLEDQTRSIKRRRVMADKENEDDA
ncbi:hypothetical protein Tco_0451880 [Tanacetum coccineum]